MLRPAVLLALLKELLCHRASALESLHQLPVSYEATWLLPRLDSHQLVVPSLARGAIRKTVRKEIERYFFVLTHTIVELKMECHSPICSV